MKTVTERNIEPCIYLKNQNEDNKAALRTFVLRRCETHSQCISFAPPKVP